MIDKPGNKPNYATSRKIAYEIVDEARPLSGFILTHADLCTEMHF